MPDSGAPPPRSIPRPLTASSGSLKASSFTSRAFLLGPLATLGLAGLFELLAGLGFIVPAPASLLLLAVVCSAFAGGIVSGLLSSVISWLFLAHVFLLAGGTSLISQSDMAQLLVWGVIFLITAFLVGSIKRRLERLKKNLSDSLEERFRILGENSSDTTMLIASDGSILFISSSIERISGWQPDELVGKNAFDYVHPEDLERTSALFARCIGTPGTQVTSEYRFRDKDGSWRTMEGVGVNHLGESNLQAVVVNARDITERKRAEGELRESEERMRNILESALDGVVGMDAAGLISAWNSRAEAIFGWPQAEVLGRTLSEVVIPQRLRTAHEKGMKHYFATGEGPVLNRRIEVKALHRDGREIDVELAISPVRRGATFEFSAFVRDITERKVQERRLTTHAAVTRTLSELGTVNQVLPRLLQKICEGLGWDFGAHWGLDSETQTLRLQFSFRSDPKELALFESASRTIAFKKGEGLPGRAWAKGEPIWIEDVSLETHFPRASPAGAEGLRGAFAFPVLVGGEVTGVMEFFRRGAAGMDADLMLIMADLGGRIGQFITREEAVDGYRRLVKAVETIQLGVTVADVGGKILYCNSGQARMHGYRVDEVLGRHVSLFAPHEEWNPEAISAFSLTELQGWRRERVSVRKNGSIFPVQLISDVVTNSAGAPIGIVTCCEEISVRKRAEEALRASEERYRLLFERNLAGVYSVTLEGRILECNEAFSRILGYASREEVMKRNASDLYVDPADRAAALQRLKEEGTLTSFELRLLRNDGGVVWVLQNETLLSAEDGSPSLIEGTLIDITDRKQAEEQIEFHAYHDALTKLPNRTLLKDRLGLALYHAHRESRALALMFLDLDHFKVINDTLGHSTGDRLLEEVSVRLQSCIREDDTVARVGGDEFVLLIPNIRGVEDATRIARKILESIARPFQIEGHELYVSTSIGIGLYPNDGSDVETLLKNADSAMYRAKEQGRNNYQLSTPLIERLASNRLSLETSLHKALEKEEMVVYYQPQIDLRSGFPCGAEALVRWQHPERGLILPSEFIPQAENLGIILPLGEWVLRQACRSALSWQRPGSPPIRTSVNLSVRQFRIGELQRTIERALADTGLPPHLLELEITESIAMQNFEQTVPILKNLSDMGISITIDDFGTGYSSFSYLKLLPIDRLKIDQSFINGIGSETRDAAIVKAIIGMAHSLELRVIAEGVETEVQLAVLRDLECDEFQGFHCSQAVPEKEFVRLLHSGRFAVETGGLDPATPAGPAASSSERDRS